MNLHRMVTCLVRQSSVSCCCCWVCNLPAASPLQLRWGVDSNMVDADCDWTWFAELSMQEAMALLDEHHYGLEKVCTRMDNVASLWSPGPVFFGILFGALSVN